MSREGAAFDVFAENSGREREVTAETGERLYCCTSVVCGLGQFELCAFGSAPWHLAPLSDNWPAL